MKRNFAYSPPGGGRHAPRGPREKITMKSVKTLGRVLGMLFKEYWFLLLIVGITTVLSSLANTRGSMFLQELVDDYIVPMIGKPNAEGYSQLLKAIFYMGLIYLVGVGSTFLHNWLMISVGQGMLRKVRARVFNKLQSLPVKYFDQHGYGNIMSLFTNDVSTLRQLISQSIPQLVTSIVTIVIVFVNMLRLSGWLTVVVLCFIALMFIFTALLGGKSGKYYIKQQASLGELNGYIEETINGQRVVKVFCHEDKAKADFDVKNEELRRNATRANSFANVVMPLMNNLGNIQYVVLAVVGGALAVSGVGGMTIGTIIAFLQLSRNFSMPVSQVSEQVNHIVLAMAGADRLFQVIDEVPEDDEGTIDLVNIKKDLDEIVEVEEHTGAWAWKIPAENGGFTYKRLCGDVILTDVDFSYVEGKQVLYDISIDAERGEKVAFVGATGAGKTTITNLLNRFYDIQDGTITYDGIDIKDIKKSALRRSLGIVLQDVNLFTGTVRDNIRYGRLDATDEEIVAAAKLANAHGFIEMLPDGYDTVLEGDGSGLSQGQRQLIAIARAAVADPPVMILDEATSSIDTRTETIVQRGMDQLMHGRTVFVIAHRLSTVMNSDLIMVLEHGHIVERGNHDQLIEQQGIYYRLYTGAFQLD